MVRHVADIAKQLLRIVPGWKLSRWIKKQLDGTQALDYLVG